MSSHPLPFRLVCLVLLLLGVPLGGQATARQGTVVDTKTTGFVSPLVIEVPLARLRAPEPEPGEVYPFTDQDKFVCEDVSIPLILIRKTVTRSHQVKLHIKTSVFVRPSFDRKVFVRYTVLTGEGTEGPSTEQELSAEEKKVSTDSSTLVLSQAAFEGLFQEGAKGRLKVVMTVVSDR